MACKSSSAISSIRLRRKRLGIALVLTLMFLPVMFLLVMATGQMMVNESRFAVQEEGNGRVFYMAEAGITAGYHSYAGSNFSRHTHDTAGAEVPTGGLRLVPGVTGYTSLTAQQTLYDGTIVPAGWHLWRWNVGDPAANSYSGSGLPEAIYYRVQQLDAQNWQIESRAQFGTFRRVNTMRGKYETPFRYAIFDAADLSEFVRGAEQIINGKVHANGNLYFSPNNGNGITVKSTTDSVQDLTIHAAGKIIRSTDAWGRSSNDANPVKIAKGGNNSNLVNMDKVSSVWFDSNHPDWLKTTGGAKDRFGSIVLDGALGAVTKDPPALQSMDPSGYYAQNAGLKITSATGTASWLKNTTFYNVAEDRMVPAKQIDMAALNVSVNKPANGVIYSEVPIIVANAADLSGYTAGVTIVGNQAVYTHGDFNKTGSSTTSGVPGSIMTRERIYHLSKKFNFDDYATKSGSPATQKTAEDTGTEIWAALIDSTITVDERAFVQSHNGVTNPNYGVNPITYNSDDLLENWGGSRTLKKRGTIMHLQNAKMAKFDNSDAGPGINPWILKSHYDAPRRDYGYDPKLVATSPPLAPVISSKGYWVSTKF